MMRLHNLRPRPGSKHRVKRLGIGESSGHGKTAGKGNKGQKARSGGSIRLGFEGGQMPLIRRLPKRGFNNAAFHKNYALVNVDDLNAFEAGSTVTEQMLRDSKVIRGNFYGVKVLGNGELKHGLTIEADKISAAARQKIESAGGTVTLRAPRGPQGPRNGDSPEAAAAKKSAAKKSSAKGGAKKSADNS
jgi:large subunit ribosomal protein L15